ncbi:MAG: thioredoxin family protein [Candidatus Gracilibacteria bacterium]|nr:thioredoxin family protein [Candidatus Gracilibacteria bacterium]MDD3120655.1 thioredoxin family protein [Candidatus Gracilibacteria bacterium]
MDWSNIKQNLTVENLKKKAGEVGQKAGELSKKAGEIGGDIGQKAGGLGKKFSAVGTGVKEFGTKTIDYTNKLIEKSPVELKNIEEYETLKDKKLIVLFGNDKNEEFKKLLIKIPVAITKAWIESGAIKVVDPDKFNDLAIKLELKTIPTLIVIKKGEILKRIENYEEINTFLLKELTFEFETKSETDSKETENKK